MNKENLLKEIEIEKQEMVQNIQLNETVLLKKFCINDSFNITLFFSFPLFFTVLFYPDNMMILTVLIMLLYFSFLTPFVLNKLLPKKNTSLSYHLMSVFKKEKINNICLLEKRKVALEKQLDKDFLTKISFHMDKAEFKKFLEKCDGKVTLKKLEKEISIKEKNNKRSQNIEELTDAIYGEHQNLIPTNKKV